MEAGSFEPVVSLVDPEEPQDRAQRGPVVAPEVLVYEDEHLLAREVRVIAAQLLHIPEVVRVEDHLGIGAAARYALSLTPGVLERHRLAQVLLGLEVHA